MLHHLFRRILESFMAPAAPSARPRQRRIRAICEFCGKDVAVVASTGKYWKHGCHVPDPPIEQDPDEFSGTHDTWEEHRGER